MKRTPMRRTAMKRRPKPLDRETGVFSEGVIAQIMVRAADEHGHVHCDACGGLIYDRRFEIHHRNPRKQGGTRNPKKATAANGAILHPECHAKFEGNRTFARVLGFLLYERMDPEAEPVRTWRGWETWTAAGGRVAMTSPPPDRALVSLSWEAPGVPVVGEPSTSPE